MLTQQTKQLRSAPACSLPDNVKQCQVRCCLESLCRQVKFPQSELDCAKFDPLIEKTCQRFVSALFFSGAKSNAVSDLRLLASQEFVTDAKY